MSRYYINPGPYPFSQNKAARTIAKNVAEATKHVKNGNNHATKAAELRNAASNANRIANEAKKAEVALNKKANRELNKAKEAMGKAAKKVKEANNAAKNPAKNAAKK